MAAVDGRMLCRWLLATTAMVLGTPTIAPASDFGSGSAYLVFAGTIVAVLALFPAAITVGILRMQTRRRWIWFLLPVMVVFWGGVIVIGFLVFLDVSASLRPRQ
jgi:hypothetical protein